MAIDTKRLYFGYPAGNVSPKTVVRFAESTKHFTPKHKNIEYEYDGICMQGVDFDSDLPAMEFQLNWKRITEGWADSGLKNAKATVRSYWSFLAKHKGLPKDAIYLKSGRWVRMRNIMSFAPTQFYAYICNWRHGWEEPGFVHNVVYLTDHGMYFWLSYLVASAISLKRSGHHVLPISCEHGHTKRADSGLFLNKRVKLSMARKLKTFFSNPKKYDDRVMKNDSYWEMHRILRSVSVPIGSRDEFTIRDILAKPKVLSDAVKATSKARVDNILGTAKPTPKPKQAKSVRDLGYKTVIGYLKGEFHVNAHTDRLNKRWIVVPMLENKAMVNRIVRSVKPFVATYEYKREMVGYTLRLKKKLVKKKKR